MKFGKGLRRDDPNKVTDKRDARQHPLLQVRLMAGRGTLNGRVLTGLAGHADLTPFEPSRFDQGPTGSCTAHSSAGAIVTALRAAGRPFPFTPSPKAIYAATRALERQPDLSGHLPGLTDSGAELADVAAALGRYGVAPLGGLVDGRMSDVDQSNVGDEPDLSTLETSGTKLVTGEYVIQPSDPQAPELAAAALESGLPVWLGFFCDTAFEDLAAGQVAAAPNESDPNGGGHAVYLSGYRTTPQGRIFVLTNSWGQGWCDEGRCLVSEAWLRATWSLYVFAVSVQAQAARVS